MKTKRAYLIAAIALLIAVMLVSCTRSVRTSGTTTAQAPQGADETIPPDATDVLSQIYIFATQTAMASSGVAATAPAVTPAAPATVAPTKPSVAPTQPVVAPQTGGGSSVVLATAPPLVVPASYSLQKGEFPFCIARRFNVDPGELLRMNGLSSYSVYYAGMALLIPQSGRGFPGGRALMAHPTSYSVRGGESLHTIACAFGDVDPNAIAVVNNLTPPYRLQPGQVLQIP
jgi:LysM repeat protein